METNPAEKKHAFIPALHTLYIAPLACMLIFQLIRIGRISESPTAVPPSTAVQAPTPLKQVIRDSDDPQRSNDAFEFLAATANAIDMRSAPDVPKFNATTNPFTITCDSKIFRADNPRDEIAKLQAAVNATEAGDRLEVLQIVRTTYISRDGLSITNLRIVYDAKSRDGSIHPGRVCEAINSGELATRNGAREWALKTTKQFQAYLAKPGRLLLPDVQSTK